VITVAASIAADREADLTRWLDELFDCLGLSEVRLVGQVHDIHENRWRPPLVRWDPPLGSFTGA
jgi:hypothetical protein